MFDCDASTGVEVSAEGPTGLGGLTRTPGVEVRFAPIAGLVGVGFAGYGVGGFVGAGIGLMLPAVSVFLGALIFEGDGLGGRGLSKRKKTLRHRWLLWLDGLGRRREFSKRERRERKEAEQQFLDSRRKRKGR
jgi:hypothetical protein